jgi:hypothetical protein
MPKAIFVAIGDDIDDSWNSIEQAQIVHDGQNGTKK